MLHIHRLAAGDNVALPDAGSLYVHLASGELALDGRVLTAGDAARLSDEKGLVAEAADAAEFLVWEFPDRPRAAPAT